MGETKPNVLKRVIKAPLVPQSQAHYSPAIGVGDFLFVSGRVATDFKSGIAPEARVNPDLAYHGSALELQADYVFKALDHLLRASGSTVGDIVSMEQFFTGRGDQGGYGLVRDRHLGGSRPPSTAVGCSALML